MRILFIDQVHPVLSERLAIAGHICEDVSSLTGEELLAQLHDAEGVVIRGRIMLDKPMLDRAPEVALHCAGGCWHGEHRQGGM